MLDSLQGLESFSPSNFYILALCIIINDNNFIVPSPHTLVLC